MEKGIILVENRMENEPQITCGELLKALNGKYFKDISKLLIHCPTIENADTLTAVCTFHNTDGLFLLSGYQKSGFDVSGITYINRSKCEDTYCVNKSELISIIKNLDEKIKVFIMTEKYDGTFYELLSILKLPKTEQVHLMAGSFNESEF